jgi:hypothetical protein
MSAASGRLAVVLLVTFMILPAHAQPGPTQTEPRRRGGEARRLAPSEPRLGGQRFVNVTGITRQNASALQPTCKVRRR